MTVFIYGLIDPDTHEVRYVGQTRLPEARLKDHLSAARAGKEGPHYDWLRQLTQTPHLVILEPVENGRWGRGNASVSRASVMEAKWLKRFRRTVLNYNKKQCAAYDEFVNSPELKERYKID